MNAATGNTAWKNSYTDVREQAARRVHRAVRETNRVMHGARKQKTHSQERPNWTWHRECRQPVRTGWAEHLKILRFAQDDRLGKTNLDLMLFFLRDFELVFGFAPSGRYDAGFLKYVMDR